MTVEGCPPLFCLRTDAAVLEASASMSTGASAPTPRLLAPLDPLIYDRTITDRLWNFKYTWEVYTPAHKRVRGYYALPILVGTQLVGHIDSKAERARGKLVVISRRVRRGHKAAAAVKQLAEFLSLRK